MMSDLEKVSKIGEFDLNIFWKNPKCSNDR